MRCGGGGRVPRVRRRDQVRNQGNHSPQQNTDYIPLLPLPPEQAAADAESHGPAIHAHHTMVPHRLDLQGRESCALIVRSFDGIGMALPVVVVGTGRRRLYRYQGNRHSLMGFLLLLLRRFPHRTFPRGGMIGHWRYSLIVPLRSFRIHSPGVDRRDHLPVRHSSEGH